MNGDIKKTGVVIQGLDVLDVTKFISRTNKKYQATLLANIEQVLTGDQNDHYAEIRKLVLDSTNNFTRTIVKTIFGDFEI